MASPDTLPPLLPVTVAGIPASMLDTPRWAPWRAVWNAKKKKYDKIPHRADRPASGLSNKSIKWWASFHTAMGAYQQNPDRFAGVGYLMTGAHDLIAVDLDHCVQDGDIAPWAAEVVAKLDSYTEISPSGTGLRVMVEGTLERDWVNHDVGIEVYGGGDARFVTITGAKLPGSPSRVRKPRPGTMDQITARYRKVKADANIEDLHLPALLPADDLPEIAELDIPAYARNFLLEGPTPGQDRSQALFACSIALNQAGLEPVVILSILESNDYAMEVALDHRRQDYDKAIRYLWKDHCRAGKARADGLKQLTLDEFDQMEGQEPTAKVETPVAEGGCSLDDFDVVEEPELSDEELLAGPAASRDLAPVKLPRFTPIKLGQFMQRKRTSWLIKGLLPRTGLAVIYGASSSGKTFFTFDLSGAVARGHDWRDTRVQQGRVVYVVAEGVEGFRGRVEAYCTFHDLDPDAVELLVVPVAPNLLDKSDIKELVQALLKVGPVAMIVVDTYARAMAGGNENDAKDTGLAVAHCDLLARKFNALVVLVHHSGKDAAKGARGSGALRAAADLEIEVVQTREYRAATVTKLKDGEDGKEYAFRLNEVVLGQDEDGDNITSCVVDAVGSVPKHQRKVEPKGEIEKLVYGQMTTLAGLEGGPVGKDQLAEMLHPMLEFDPAVDKKDRRKEAIKRAIGTLISKNLLVDVGLSVEIAQ